MRTSTYIAPITHSFKGNTYINIKFCLININIKVKYSYQTSSLHLTLSYQQPSQKKLSATQ